jgi:hypothetical protein
MDSIGRTQVVWLSSEGERLRANNRDIADE